jgi:hypothetical protein
MKPIPRLQIKLDASQKTSHRARALRVFWPQTFFQNRHSERTPVTMALRLPSPLGCQMRCTFGWMVQPGTICTT